MKNLEQKIYIRSEYINCFKKYGVVYLGEVHKFLPSKPSKMSSYRALSELEALGVVKKMRIPTLSGEVRFAVILSEKFCETIGHSRRNDRFNHDLILTCVVGAFRSLPSFMDVMLEAEWEKHGGEYGFDVYSITPDAVVITENEDNLTEAVVAIEVELSRKSSKRVVEKLIKYSSEKKFDQVMYFINDIETWRAYMKILDYCLKNDKKNDYKRVTLIRIQDPLRIADQLGELTIYSYKGESRFGDVFLKDYIKHSDIEKQ